MKFSIDTYDRKYLEGMVDVFNAETVGENHIAPLDPELFITLVESKSCFEPGGLFVAVEHGAVIGWAHACVAAGSEPWHDPKKKAAHIRMLVYPRNRLDVGQVLVEEATGWLEQGGHEELLAIHAQVGYPLYRGLWMGGEPICPASLPHLQLAFEVGGYRNTLESVFMTAVIGKELPEVPSRVEIEFDEGTAIMAHESMRESWVGFEPMRIRAMIGREEVGTVAWVILPHVAPRLGAPCMNIWGMGVKEEQRRKGIASALMGRAMMRACEKGVRFASVGTMLWNAAAHATYARFGFEPHRILVGRTRKKGSEE